MADSASRGRPAAAVHDAAAATQRLLDVMARLLGPGGCPWDRAQTHRSLLPYLLEEAYELIDAVERVAPPTGSQPTGSQPAGAPPSSKPSGPVRSDSPGAAPGSKLDGGLADPTSVREELGDVLLQVVFHAGLAEQAGAFDFAAVAGGLADKLVERHPHVFGAEHHDTAAQVSDAWDRRKLAGRASRLDGIPAALPALMLAAKVSSRAAKSGFEWNRTEEIYAKAHEELDEFQAAMSESQGPDEKGQAAARGERAAAAAHAELEFGDLLFSLVQVARWSGIDAEAALRRATAKFAARFRHMEQALRDQGRDPAAVTNDEWWALWAAAKKEETHS
jgi:MazG family protein